jgi:hypothetical protein
MRIVKSVKIATLSLLIAGASGAPVIALGSTTGQAHAMGQSTTTTDTTTNSTTTTDTTSSKADTAKAKHEARLTAVKLRVCENRQKTITNIMSRIADRGQKQLDLFTTIATRTETFYLGKGKTLSNYDALVTAANDKKAAAQTTVDTIKADSTTFSCDGTDPKGAVSSFKTALKSEIQALKDYKTAVKDLIVGVKSVQSTTANTTSTTDTTKTEDN